MAAKRLTSEEWAGYLELYRLLSERLSAEAWFKEGWECRYKYLNPESPQGAWFRLIRHNWFDGNIHFETWVNNAVLDRKATPLVLHIETSKDKHGVSRNDFTRHFLAKHGATIAGWPGYTLKPNYPLEPFNIQVPFTRETLVANLSAELNRLQTLGSSIDETILAVKR